MMKILVGYNGSKVAETAVTFAAGLARKLDGQMYIVASMEGGTGEKIEEIRRVKEDLEKARRLVEQGGIACETEQLARGLTPGEDLVRFAWENDIDHIVVGIEKKSRTRKLLLGSTAQYVILKAPCPVTSVK
jgi:nucleotide-binding universal stress UspA family protein